MEKQNNEITFQSTNEIESLNDNEELDLESLEEIAGGSWGCPKKQCGCFAKENSGDFTT